MEYVMRYHDWKSPESGQAKLDLITQRYKTKQPTELWFLADNVSPILRLQLTIYFENVISEACHLQHTSNITLQRSNQLPGKPLLIRVINVNQICTGITLGNVYCPLYCVGHSDGFSQDLGFIDFSIELKQPKTNQEPIEVIH